MNEIEDIKLDEEQASGDEVKLSQEQTDHFIALVEFLCGTYNVLINIVKEEKEGSLVVDAEGFNSVLHSLKTTASNFAGLIGAELRQGKEELSEQEKEIVDGD